MAALEIRHSAWKKCIFSVFLGVLLGFCLNCFKPIIPDSNIHCGLDHICPTNYSCGPDKLCYKEGTRPLFVTLQVEPVYKHHTNWNDYVLLSIPSKPRHQQPEHTCIDAFSDKPNRCFHGAEFLQVKINNQNDCTGLSLSDNLGAFNWICDDTEVLTFFSIGFRQDKGLQTLLNPTSFKENWVSLKKNGAILGESKPSLWWDNRRVRNLSELKKQVPIRLNQPGTVYVLNTLLEVQEISIEANQIGLVVLPNGCLKQSDVSDSNTFITATDVRYLWFEGNFEGRSELDYDAVFFGLQNMHQSVFRNVHIQNGDRSIELSQSHNNRFSNINIGNSAAGFYLEDSHDNRFDHLVFHNNEFGIFMYNSVRNIFVNLLLAHNDFGASLWNSSSKNIISHCTIVGQSNYALHIDGGWKNIFAQVVIHNSGNSAAIGLDGGPFTSNKNIFDQLVLANHSSVTLGIYAIRTRFTGNLLIDQSCNCQVERTARNYPGLENQTCAVTDNSDAILFRDFSLCDSFEGPVAQNDGKNQSDQNGLADYNTIQDWTQFDNRYRSWGKNNPNSCELESFRGRCSNSESNAACQIWDWRLKANDEVLRNRSSQATEENIPFVVGQTCPVAVHGDRVITDEEEEFEPFLVNAQERLSDNLGNEDGLCQSNETCIYSPHFGVYQGEGPLSSDTCLFEDGFVHNVKMLAHPVENN